MMEERERERLWSGLYPSFDVRSEELISPNSKRNNVVCPCIRFHLSHLATEGLSRPQQLMKICSFWSRSFQAARPAAMAHCRCVPRSNRVWASTSDAVRWRVAASKAVRTLGAVSTGLRIASPPSLMPWVRSWWYSPSISADGIPRRAGKKLVRIAASRGKKNEAVSATIRWTYCHSFCRQKVKPA
jgi:hypothetical protein